MTERFYLDISRNGQKWCDISIDSRGARQMLTDIEAKFPATQGYACRVFLEEEARRLVEVADQARVIAITYSRSPFPAPDGIG